jgi:hypothetical protein
LNSQVSALEACYCLSSIIDASGSSHSLLLHCCLRTNQAIRNIRQVSIPMSPNQDYVMLGRNLVQSSTSNQRLECISRLGFITTCSCTRLPLPFSLHIHGSLSNISPNVLPDEVRRVDYARIWIFMSSHRHVGWNWLDSGTCKVSRCILRMHHLLIFTIFPTPSV